MREVGANPGESQAGDLHVALARECVAGALNDELGYTVGILGIQRIVFIHGQILRRRPSRGIIETVNRQTRSHHELLDSGGKSRRYHVITQGYVVTEYCRVAEHVGSFPRTRLRIESVAGIGKLFSGEMDHRVGAFKGLGKILRPEQIDHRTAADAFRDRHFVDRQHFVIMVEQFSDR